MVNNINEAGRRLLVLEGEDFKDKKYKEKEVIDFIEKGVLFGGEISVDEKIDVLDLLLLYAFKRKRVKRAGIGVGKEELEGLVNEELKVLEVYMLSLFK